MTRTYVDNDTFIFASDVETDGGYRATIAVQWFSFSFRPNPSSLIAIDRFTASRPEVSEVWFLFPRDVEPSLRLLAKLDEYEDRASHLSLLSFRFFVVEGDGRWLEVEIGATPLDPTIEASQRTISQIRADGMRQIFRDTEALATASSGFHFERPGRGHSEVFMRTSQTVARSQHAYFLAAALLRHVSPSDGSRLFADTGGILPLLHAVADLWVRLTEHTGDVIVDSFGSYEGYENNLRIVEGRDWVIISSSTSGSLSRTLIESSYAQFDRTITLYYLSSVPPTPDMGRVLCDLTLPAAHEGESVRDARMPPPLSYRVDASQECGLCAEGSRSIELIGDGFFPAPTSLKLRMPSRIDRPLHGKRERVGLTGRNFDNEDYFSDFYGLGVIVGPSSSGDDPTVSAPTQYGVSTRLGHLVAVEGAAEGESIRRKLLSKARQVLRGASPLSAVVALADDDSRNLAQFVGKEIMGDAGVETAKGLWTWGAPADVPPLPLDEGLARVEPGSTLLVCAGTLGSGRALLALSRELRVLPASVETRYLVSVSHPESVNSQEIFLQSLGLRGSSLGSRIEIGWQLPREPRSPGAKNAWDAEWTLLRAVAETLAERWPEFEGSRELDAIDARTRVLSEPPDTLLFAAPDFREDNLVGIPSINPKFALWPFDWDEHDSFKLRSRRPSQPEIYATIAHFLYESRNMNPLVGSHASGARRHGHAINPGIFDRLNDPQIQAAILRAVEPGELDYHADLDASRTAAEILGFVVAHVNDEGGQATYEFLLSIAHGIYFPNGMGMRLHEAELRARMALIESRTETFSALPPLCAALARAIIFRITPAE